MELIFSLHPGMWYHFWIAVFSGRMGRKGERKGSFTESRQKSCMKRAAWQKLWPSVKMEPAPGIQQGGTWEITQITQMPWTHPSTPSRVSWGLTLARPTRCQRGQQLWVPATDTRLLENKQNKSRINKDAEYVWRMGRWINENSQKTRLSQFKYIAASCKREMKKAVKL